MEFETYMRWLFADAPELAAGIELEFVELQPYGQKGQVITWLGATKEFIGDWRCFPSKVKNLKEIMLKLGKDETTWKGKHFRLIPDIEKKAFVATLLN